MATKHAKRRNKKRTLKRGGNDNIYTSYLQRIENYFNFMKQYGRSHNDEDKIISSEKMLKNIEGIDSEIKYVEKDMNKEMAKFAEKLTKLNASKEFFTNNIDIFDNLVQLIRNYDKLNKSQLKMLNKIFAQKDLVYVFDKAHRILWHEIFVYYKNHTDVLRNPNTDFRNNVIIPFLFNSDKPRYGSVYIFAFLSLNMHFEINHVEKNHKKYDEKSLADKLFFYPYLEDKYEILYHILFHYYSYYFKDVEITQYLINQRTWIENRDDILGLNNEKNRTKTQGAINELNEFFDYYNMPEYKLSYEQLVDFYVNKSQFIDKMTDETPNNTQQLTNQLYSMNQVHSGLLDADTVEQLSNYTNTNPIQKPKKKKPSRADNWY